MAKVRIIVQGIAMSYHKDDRIWKVIFPFDEGLQENCHNVRLSVNGGVAVPLAQAKRTIEIKAVNPVSVFGTGTGYEKFLDLTAEYLHEGGIIKKNKWEDRSVLMSIENAVFSLRELTASKYSVELNGQITKAADYVGYSGVAEIEAEQVNIEIRGLDTIPLISDATVIFDNTCEEKTDSNIDFQMLYNLVRDKDDPDKKFDVKRDPNDMPGGFDAGRVLKNNPAPGEDGLPCHKIRVSNPVDLP